MRLVTAHRILIGAAVIFFGFFAVQRFLAYRANGDSAVLAVSVIGLVAAAGLATYYRTIGGGR